MRSASASTTMCSPLAGRCSRIVRSGAAMRSPATCSCTSAARSHGVALPIAQGRRADGPLQLAAIERGEADIRTLPGDPLPTLECAPGGALLEGERRTRGGVAHIEETETLSGRQGLVPRRCVIQGEQLAVRAIDLQGVALPVVDNHPIGHGL